MRKKKTSGDKVVNGGSFDSLGAVKGIARERKELRKVSLESDQKNGSQVVGSYKLRKKGGEQRPKGGDEN